jgi:thiamine kinase-like enzyme
MKDVQNEVNVARWLASLDFPAAQVTDVEQPIVVAGHPVTFWHYIPGPIGGRGSIGAMGTLLRRLHALPRPSTFRLPVEDILGRIAPRIEKVSIPPADKEFLSLRLVELRSMISQLYFPLPASPTHGDAHTDNLIISDGRPVLIDFERFSWGQPEWDLALTATEYQMAGWWSEEEYRAFVDAYGYDVTTWSGFPVLREVHALKMTTWLMQNVQESQEIAAEYAVRMQTLRDGVVQPWRAF